MSPPWYAGGTRPKPVTPAGGGSSGQSGSGGGSGNTIHGDAGYGSGHSKQTGASQNAAMKAQLQSGVSSSWGQPNQTLPYLGADPYKSYDPRLMKPQSTGNSLPKAVAQAPQPMPQPASNAGGQYGYKNREGVNDVHKQVQMQMALYNKDFESSRWKGASDAERQRTIDQVQSTIQARRDAQERAGKPRTYDEQRYWRERQVDGSDNVNQPTWYQRKSALNVGEERDIGQPTAPKYLRQTPSAMYSPLTASYKQEQRGYSTYKPQTWYAQQNMQALPIKLKGGLFNAKIPFSVTDKNGNEVTVKGDDGKDYVDMHNLEYWTPKNVGRGQGLPASSTNPSSTIRTTGTSSVTTTTALSGGTTTRPPPLFWNPTSTTNSAPQEKVDKLSTVVTAAVPTKYKNPELMTNSDWKELGVVNPELLTNAEKRKLGVAITPTPVAVKPRTTMISSNPFLFNLPTPVLDMPKGNVTKSTPSKDVSYDGTSTVNTTTTKDNWAENTLNKYWMNTGIVNTPVTMRPFDWGLFNLWSTPIVHGGADRMAKDKTIAAAGNILRKGAEEAVKKGQVDIAGGMGTTIGKDVYGRGGAILSKTAPAFQRASIWQALGNADSVWGVMKGGGKMIAKSVTDLHMFSPVNLLRAGASTVGDIVIYAGAGEIGEQQARWRSDQVRKIADKIPDEYPNIKKAVLYQQGGNVLAPISGEGLLAYGTEKARDYIYTDKGARTAFAAAGDVASTAKYLTPITLVGGDSLINPDFLNSKSLQDKYTAAQTVRDMKSFTPFDMSKIHDDEYQALKKPDNVLETAGAGTSRELFAFGAIGLTKYAAYKAADVAGKGLSDAGRLVGGAYDIGMMGADAMRRGGNFQFVTNDMKSGFDIGHEGGNINVRTARSNVNSPRGFEVRQRNFRFWGGEGNGVVKADTTSVQKTKPTTSNNYVDVYRNPRTGTYQRPVDMVEFWGEQRRGRSGKSGATNAKVDFTGDRKIPEFLRKTVEGTSPKKLTLIEGKGKDWFKFDSDRGRIDGKSDRIRIEGKPRQFELFGDRNKPRNRITGDNGKGQDRIDGGDEQKVIGGDDGGQKRIGDAYDGRKQLEGREDRRLLEKERRQLEEDRGKDEDRGREGDERGDFRVTFPTGGLIPPIPIEGGGTGTASGGMGGGGWMSRSTALPFLSPNQFVFGGMVNSKGMFGVRKLKKPVKGKKKISFKFKKKGGKK